MSRSRGPTGALVVVASLALAATGCGGGGFELSVGDCATIPPDGSASDGMAEVRIVDCDEEHQLEVFHVLELGPEQTVPDVMVDEITDVCLGAAWTDYLGVAPDETSLELLPIPPAADDLADGEDREVVCTVREPGNATRTGSLRSTGPG